MCMWHRAWIDECQALQIHYKYIYQDTKSSQNTIFKRDVNDHQNPDNVNTKWAYVYYQLNGVVPTSVLWVAKPVIIVIKLRIFVDFRWSQHHDGIGVGMCILSIWRHIQLLFSQRELNKIYELKSAMIWALLIEKTKVSLRLGNSHGLQHLYL
jgi:hypothetical protein